ncbi:glycoside hydrolase family 28 protein [Marinoscillum sp. MHG1-6]|uniref:glycoside hydrolase family 28 protein n=1 Tax=Marinoscillum sp. MHG1-6 TaxID=2959627 RepID=UPI002157BEAE|nr:glycoside hydrolase family 28 protein [Marinoscillum sp. MHG1-6]
MMILRIFPVIGLLSILFACTGSQEAPLSTSETNDETSSLYSNLEFEMPLVKAPAFPDYAVNIKDFGAQPGGLFDNSDAIASAIEDVSENGGGKVIVPRGIWLTGPIKMKSNINIHLEDGALVQFSADFDSYPLVATSFEGLETYRCISPINAVGLENVAFTGNGTFDGAGDAWRFVKRGKMTEGQWKALLSKGGVLSDDGNVWFPTEKSKKGYTGGPFNVPNADSKEQLEEIKDFLRPVMVSIVSCKNVLLDGPTFQNSPAWNIHPLMCENVIIRNLSVRNPWYSQNGDGLDLESCKNALIYNNTFDVGDDAICIKSGKNEDGRKRGMPTENVIVKNNIVYHGHGGFVVGSEMSGGVRNLHVSSCTFMGTDIGLRFKSTRGRGGIVENIYISDIDMINVPAEAIRFNLFYGGQSPVLEEGQEESNKSPETPAMPVTEETPSFRNIYMKNINSVGSSVAGFFQGLPEMNLKNVVLENAVLHAKKGVTFIDVDGVTFKNVTILNEQGAPLTVYNGKNVSIDGFEYSEEMERALRVFGSGTASSSYSIDQSKVFIGEEVEAEELTFK